MFADARNVPHGGTLQTDLCVIGAGAAGITLARSLIGRSTRVTVLESGGLTFDTKTQDLYQGPNVGLPYFPLDTPRLRMFGGTTNHWAGVCRPFDATDYEQRAWIPYSGWPFGKSTMDPYYARAEQVVHLEGDHWSTQGWVSQDTLKPLPLAGDNVETRVDQIVPEALRSFSTDYGGQLKAASNVTVYLEANVTEIETDPSGANVTQVQVATLSGNRFVVEAPVFVLAVGGIENPRLLLASRRHHPNGIGNEHDLVGRFFLEHPRFIAGVIAPAERNLSVGFYLEHHLGQAIVQPRLGITRAAQQAEGMADVQFTLDPVYDPALQQANQSTDVAALKALRHAISRRGLGDIGSELSTVIGDLMSWHRFVVPGAPLPIPYPEVVGEVMRVTPRDRQSLIPGLLGDVASFLYTRMEGNIPVNSVTVTSRFEPLPNPDSRVTLANQRDALGMPRAELNWELSDGDKRNVERGMQLLAGAVGGSGVGRVRISFDPHAATWPADLAGGYHLMGTTRMHDDPRHGVVDANGLVHGMSNLYIAGSSVFPTAGSGNPTMLIVALTLRLSDHLRAVALR